MSRTVKTQAIVLRKKSLPTKDKLVILFTKEHGKVLTIAKGIKKITSRRLPHVETANLIDVILYRRGDYHYFQESRLISGFTKIKQEQSKIKAMYSYFFVLERMLPENQPETALFSMTVKFLIHLSGKRIFSELDVEEHLNQVLLHLGYLKHPLSRNELFSAIEEIIHEKIPSTIM